MLAAFAQGLPTLLGAASEASGLDRVLNANTVKKRTHSLFRQGSYWYLALPNLGEDRLRPLMEAFGKIVAAYEVSRELLGFIRGDASGGGRQVHEPGSTRDTALLVLAPHAEQR
jgi:hypothetical protein